MHIAIGQRPSIDFLFLDAAGGLVAGELKRTITAPRECWSALCQVTHRAHLLAQSFSVDRLESAFRDCLSGEHGRPQQSTSNSLIERWHDYFGNRTCDRPLGAGPIRRLVLATEFGPSWPGILECFNSQDLHTTASQLRAAYQVSSKSNREMSRFDVLATVGTSLEVSGNVMALRVDR